MPLLLIEAKLRLDSVLAGLNQLLQPPQYALPDFGLFWIPGRFIPEFIITHRACSTRNEPWISPLSGTWNFQVVFFEPESPMSLFDVGWNAGTLYLGKSSRLGNGRTKKMRKSAITVGPFLRISTATDTNIISQISIIKDRFSSANGKKYWTMVLLLPSSLRLTKHPSIKDVLNHLDSQEDGWSPYGVFPPLVQRVVRSWTQLINRLDELLDEEQVSFMSPEEYVHLLYDDATFSRSRFYFWAIGCLLALDSTLAGNIETLSSVEKDEFWFIPVDEEVKRDCKQKIKQDCLELIKMRAHVKDRLEIIQSLRDGVRHTPALLTKSCIAHTSISFSAPVASWKADKPGSYPRTSSSLHMSASSSCLLPFLS